MIKIKLIYDLLRAKAKLGGCNFNLNEMIQNRDLKAFYPLHDSEQAKDLWANFTFGTESKKFDLFREYFGEKLALYFNFLAHLSKWLIIPGVIGLGLSIVTWYYQDFSHPVLPFFAVIISFWSFSMIEYWKRTSKDVTH